MCLFYFMLTWQNLLRSIDRKQVSWEKKYDLWHVLIKCLNPLTHGRFHRPITHIANSIKQFLYIHIVYPKFFLLRIFSFRVLGLKKASKFDLFKNVKTKIFIFGYFPRIPSEMNYTHPFYPILIPIHSICEIF